MLERLSSGKSKVLPPNFLGRETNKLSFIVGIFRSATHRVTLPNHGEKLDATSNKITPARYSIPYFVVPDENEMVRCFTSCILDERPLKFEPVTVTEYAADITRYQYKNKK